jgi:hypothetical protein
MRPDFLKNRLNLIQYLVVSESQYYKSFGVHGEVSVTVPNSLFGGIMNRPV